MPITGPQRRVTASCAAPNDPRAASIAASFARECECRPAGRDRAASAGHQLAAPGFRQAHRVTVTVPNRVASSRECPVSSRVRVIRSVPVTGARLLPGLLLFPRRPQVVVVLQQLQQDVPALPVHESSSSAAVSPAAAGPPSPAASAVNMAFETANGSSGGPAQYAAMRVLLSSGPDSVSTFEPRKKNPLLSGFSCFPCVILQREQAAGHPGQPAPRG